MKTVVIAFLLVGMMNVYSIGVHITNGKCSKPGNQHLDFNEDFAQNICQPAFDGALDFNGLVARSVIDSCTSKGTFTLFSTMDCSGPSSKPLSQACSDPVEYEEGGYSITLFCRCNPKVGTTSAQCSRKIRMCGWLSPMRWTGKGCRINKKVQQDGGCQCKDYCGFKCRSTCEAKLNRKYCQWDRLKNVCLSRSTGLPGTVSLNCQVPESLGSKPSDSINKEDEISSSWKHLFPSRKLDI